MTSADRPLVGRPRPDTWHPRLYGAELFGTAALVTGGVSVVILMFGRGSASSVLLPSEGARRFLTGLLFGIVGALITVSPLGRISGAHLNPAITIAFHMEGKLTRRDALGYVCAQLLGGLLSILPLRAWGEVGLSIHYGATLPRAGDAFWIPLLGEVCVTFALVTLIFVMTCNRRLRRFTPWSIAALFGVMVWLEAPLSGTSTNPARSLGPAVLSGDVSHLWIYLLGPIMGSILAVRFVHLDLVGHHHPPCARLAHFRQEERSP